MLTAGKSCPSIGSCVELAVARAVSKASPVKVTHTADCFIFSHCNFCTRNAVAYAQTSVHIDLQACFDMCRVIKLAPVNSSNFGMPAVRTGPHTEVRPVSIGLETVCE